MIILRGKSFDALYCLVLYGRRAGESQEFSLDDPVHIAILDSLVIGVLLDVESVVVVKAALDGFRQPSQAIQNGQVERRDPVRCIPERDERRVDPDERLVCLLRTSFQNYHGEATDQKCRVCSLVGVVRRIIVYSLVRKLRVLLLFFVVVVIIVII